tara:strand:- start:2077 stop:2244 length:168 start_codon:yes stop_codon:yes gene_type:complete
MKYMSDWIDDLCERFYKHTNWAYRETISDEEFKKLLKENKILNDVHIVFFKDKEK